MKRILRGLVSACCLIGNCTVIKGGMGTHPLPRDADEVTLVDEARGMNVSFHRMASFSEFPAPSSGGSDDSGILDVLFILTPQAYTSAGRTASAVDALVDTSVKTANKAFANSNAPLRMRSVGAIISYDTHYREAGFDTDLLRVRTMGDGYFDDDVAQRVELGADAVVLFVSESSYCGEAYQWATSVLAFAVVSTQCPQSVVHEVGHLIGLNHDRNTMHNFNHSQYNFGYCWDTSQHGCSRSVMAYTGCVTPSGRTNCERSLYFSSPLLRAGDLDRPTGTPTSDNARVLREQWRRAINWMPSKVAGGLIFTVQPAYAVVGRCEAVTISGWRIGTGSDITAVTLNGLLAQRILWQTQDAVQVLTALSSTPGQGDVVITTSSGHQTNLTASFAYEPQHANISTDFENGKLGSTWASVGSLDWRVLRYCDALPCDNEPNSGPAVGFNGTGNFARAKAVDDTPVTAILEASFSTHVSGGCTESVHGISLYYHLWGPQTSLCQGSLSIEYQNTAQQWFTVATATAVQANQDDPWLPLSYRFPNPESVLALRITARPYSGPASCYFWGSVSVDQIVIDKSTTCPDDNCNFISAHPTVAITAAPSIASSSAPTVLPPTTAPTASPSTPWVPATEYVRFSVLQPVRGAGVEHLFVDPSLQAAFLSAAADALGTCSSCVCCMVQASTVEVQSHSLRSAANVPTSGSVTYSARLLVPRFVPNDIVTVASRSYLSAEAAAAFNASRAGLIDSVQNGRFLASWAAAANVSEAVADVQFAALSASSFVNLTSEIVLVKDEPSAPPTVAPAPGVVHASSAVRMAILLAVLAVVACCTLLALQLWRRRHASSSAWKPLAQEDSTDCQDELDMFTSRVNACAVELVPVVHGPMTEQPLQLLPARAHVHVQVHTGASSRPASPMKEVPSVEVKQVTARTPTMQPIRMSASLVPMEVSGPPVTHATPTNALRAAPLRLRCHLEGNFSPPPLRHTLSAGAGELDPAADSHRRSGNFVRTSSASVYFNLPTRATMFPAPDEQRNGTSADGGGVRMLHRRHQSTNEIGMSWAEDHPLVTRTFSRHDFAQRGRALAAHLPPLAINSAVQNVDAATEEQRRW